MVSSIVQVGCCCPHAMCLDAGTPKLLQGLALSIAQLCFLATMQPQAVLWFYILAVSVDSWLKN